MTLLEDLKEKISFAKALGWAGLVPFMLATIFVLVAPHELISIGYYAGTFYGAIILSFLGAVHWGLAMADNRKAIWFAWSVLPSLLSFGILMIFEIPLCLFGLVPVFVLTWFVDLQAAKSGYLPVWYMNLRHMLTIGAIIALCTIALIWLIS